MGVTLNCFYSHSCAHYLIDVFVCWFCVCYLWTIKTISTQNTVWLQVDIQIVVLCWVYLNYKISIWTHFISLPLLLCHLVCLFAFYVWFCFVLHRLSLSWYAIFAHAFFSLDFLLYCAPILSYLIYCSANVCLYVCLRSFWHAAFLLVTLFNWSGANSLHQFSILLYFPIVVAGSAVEQTSCTSSSPSSCVLFVVMLRCDMLFTRFVSYACALQCTRYLLECCVHSLKVLIVLFLFHLFTILLQQRLKMPSTPSNV